LTKFSWTPIVRHQKVITGASPDDPLLADYWRRRRKRQVAPVTDFLADMLRQQHGRCPRCKHLLLYADQMPQTPREWEAWHKAIRTAARSAESSGNRKRQLLHLNCADHTRRPKPPQGLLEP
jgi:RNA-directed DNA polymerase